MKLVPTFLLGTFALFLAATTCHAAPRGQMSSSTHKKNNNRKEKLRRQLMMDTDDKKNSGSGTSDAGESSSSNLFAEDECAICTPENKQRPLRLVVQYIGGLGLISKYQDEEKATCRDQDFPMSGTLSAYGVEYSFEDGFRFELLAPGDKFDAETDFTFSNGEECYIHTSCSQPLVAGDQIGPFLILEGNDCVYEPSYCGDGNVDEGEECDDGNNIDGDGCQADCTLPFCGDGILDEGEECDDGNNVDGDGCQANCKLPSCGDGILDEGEECDDGNNIDGDGCQANCKLPFCGDGIMDAGEECDDGNNIDGDGCEADCKFCVCEASAQYDENTGAVTIDYEYCDVEPVRYDFIGIYPCDAEVMVGSKEWWDSLCDSQLAACGDFKYGYEEGQTYVKGNPIWWTYTCGGPGTSTCQQDATAEWPSNGSVTIDPSVTGASWAFGGEGGADGNRALAPGCYKVLMNREIDYISAPPYPTICADWGEALEFTVS